MFQITLTILATRRPQMLQLSLMFLMILNQPGEASEYFSYFD